MPDFQCMTNQVALASNESAEGLILGRTPQIRRSVKLRHKLLLSSSPHSWNEAKEKVFPLATPGPALYA